MFFMYHDIAVERKVARAAYHLEGEAHQWAQ